MSDYFAACAIARSLREMEDAREERRCAEQGITKEAKEAASREIAALYDGLAEVSAREQLRRYERMHELALVRGYFYDPDPACDLMWIDAVNARMAQLRRVVPGARS